MSFLVLGNLGIAIRGQVAHDDRDLIQSGTGRCTQPLGAEVNWVPAITVGRMHDERLEDAALTDVLGTFSNRLIGELGPWVVRVLVRPVHPTAGALPWCEQALEHRHRHEHRSACADVELV